MIYIIEDSPLKARKISELIGSIVVNEEIKILGSFQTGLKEIEKLSPKLIVLDMTLPTFDRVPNGREGRLRALGGYDLMKKMQYKKLVSKVVVLTQLESFGDGEEEISFEEVTLRCKRDFPDFFIDSIFFEQTGSAWESALIAIIERVILNDN